MSEITRTRGVMSGVPCIAGTRIPVSAIKSFHKAKFSVTAIRREYPTLSPKQIRAAIAWKDDQ